MRSTSSNMSYRQPPSKTKERNQIKFCSLAKLANPNLEPSFHLAMLCLFSSFARFELIGVFVSVVEYLVAHFLLGYWFLSAVIHSEVKLHC